MNMHPDKWLSWMRSSRTQQWNSKVLVPVGTYVYFWVPQREAFQSMICTRPTLDDTCKKDLGGTSSRVLGHSMHTSVIASTHLYFIGIMCSEDVQGTSLLYFVSRKKPVRKNMYTELSVASRLLRVGWHWASSAREQNAVYCPTFSFFRDFDVNRSPHFM